MIRCSQILRFNPVLLTDELRLSASHLGLVYVIFESSQSIVRRNHGTSHRKHALYRGH